MPATYEPIATTTVSGSSTSTITFSSISGSYTDLVIAINLGTSNQNGIKIMLNNDTGTNYSNTRLYGNGTSASSSRRTSTATVYLDDGVAFSTGAGDNNTIIHFMNYSNTTTYKTWLQRGNAPANGTVAVVGLYRSTSAITRIDFTAVGATTFTADSTFTLYGIKAA
jgi:hypothetical protein